MNNFFVSNPDVIAPEKNTVTLVKDGEALNLGSSELIVHCTPGHTDGAISIQLQAVSSDTSYKALIFGGVGTNYRTVELANKYLKSVAKLKRLHEQDPFYINLANHPHKAALFQKMMRRSETEDPLVDAAAFTRFLAQLQRAGELRHRELAYKRPDLK